MKYCPNCNIEANWNTADCPICLRSLIDASDKGTIRVQVESKLTPFQRDRITAALKWVRRIRDRQNDLPPLFMDNCDPSGLVKDLERILAENND